MSILDQIMDEPLQDLPSEAIRNWSEYQAAFFDIVKGSEDSVQLEAVAGSGKSTTLCEVPSLARGPVIFLAFMRANAEDLRGKIGHVAEVKTFNSLGGGMLWKMFRGSKLEKHKLSMLMQEIGQSDLTKEFGQTIQQAVRLGKNDALGMERKAQMWDFVDIIEKHDLDVPDNMKEQVALYAQTLFQRSVDTTAIYDFDDQLYFPCFYNSTFPYFPTIVVDEDQDLSPIQHLILDRLKKTPYGSGESRILGAGDRRQAIYAFRGALANSVDLLKSRFQMREAPLSISYRCAKAIVEAAKEYCPQIEARPGAPEGEILYVEEDPPFWTPDQMVLCRTNAPLFRSILSYVRQRRPCQVKSNFLDQLESFVRRQQAGNLTQLRDKIDLWYAKEKEAAQKKSQKTKLILLKDKYETLCLLIKQSEGHGVGGLLDLLKSLAESKTGTIFSTIHKAKGLEADDVYLLRPDLMPAPWVDPPIAPELIENPEDFEASVPSAEYEQELNMLYVAITRAKTKLTFGASV